MSELKIQNLTASYSSLVLNDVSFSAQSGQLVALCGPNGCGKSTLLSAIGAVSDSALHILGTITLDNKKITSFSRRQLAQKIAYMEQAEHSTWNFLVSDYVLQGRFAYSKNGYYSKADEDFCHQVILETGIEALAERKVHELSGGEFQKVRIARAFAQNPQFLLLDEPAANLDFVYEPKLMQMLKEAAVSKNLGIIISMHDVNLAARYADQLVFLPPAAPVISGSPSQVLTTENLQKTFGVEFTKGDSKDFFVPKLTGF